MTEPTRNTVRAALASDAPPKYQRGPVASAVDDDESRIRALLASSPRYRPGRGMWQLRAGLGEVAKMLVWETNLASVTATV